MAMNFAVISASVAIVEAAEERQLLLHPDQKLIDYLENALIPHATTIKEAIDWIDDIRYRVDNGQNRPFEMANFGRDLDKSGADVRKWLKQGEGREECLYAQKPGAKFRYGDCPPQCEKECAPITYPINLEKVQMCRALTNKSDCKQNDDCGWDYSPYEGILCLRYDKPKCTKRTKKTCKDTKYPFQCRLDNKGRCKDPAKDMWFNWVDSEEEHDLHTVIV